MIQLEVYLKASFDYSGIYLLPGYHMLRLKMQIRTYDG